MRLPRFPLLAILLLPVLGIAAGEPPQLSATARAIERAAHEAPERLPDDPAPRRTVPAGGPVEAPVTTSDPLPTTAAPRTSAATRPARHRSRLAARRAPRAVEQDLDGTGGIVITVSSQLAPGQLAERLTLLLEGRPIAQFTLDARHPQARARIALPGPGRLRYVAAGVIDADPRGASAVSGRGCIEILPGARYRLQRARTGLQFLRLP